MENNTRKAVQRTCNILALAACLAIIQPVSAAQVSATWVGGNSTWNTSGNWSPTVVPNNNVTDTYNVFIDSDGGTGSSVSLNTNASIDNLTVDLGDSLGFNNASNLTVGNGTSGSITNNGGISLNSAGTSTALKIDGDISLNGSGVLTMGNFTANRINAVTAGDHLTNNSTIQGAGSIGSNSMDLTNAAGGLINANASSGVLTIDPGPGGVINNGTLRASGSGGLKFGDGLFDNNTSIDVLAGSKLVSSNNTEIQGGTVNVDGSGFFQAFGGTTLDAVTVAGTGSVEQNNANAVTIKNGLTNNSTWNMNSAGTTTALIFDGTQTLDGSGSVVLSNFAGNQIRSALAGEVLTLAATQSIEGTGNIGVNTGGFVNNGSIEATNTASLVIDPGTSDSFINNATLKASGTGGLKFNAGLFDNNTSIDVLAGSKLVSSNNTEIQGGTVNVDGSGFFQALGGTTLDAVTVAGTGSVEQNNANAVTIKNGLTNNSTWNMNSAGTTTALIFDGTQTLDGSGSVVLSNFAGNQIRSALAGEVLTLAATQSIEGTGNIGVNTGGFVNNGSIEATNTASLVIDPGTSDSFINNATLKASGTGGLKFNAGLFDNNTSIDVLAGSKLVSSNNTEIQGGTVNVDGSGFFQALGGTTLDGVTVAGTGSVEQNNANAVTIKNGLTNNSTWNMNSAGTTTALIFDGTQTLDGSGSVVLSNFAGNQIRSALAGEVLTLAATQSIEGTGNIGVNTGGFVNNGSIEATNTASLVIDPGTSDSFINNATLKASGTGGLKFNAGLFDNNTSIDVLAGSKLVSSNNTEIQGGTVNVDGSGFFQALGGTTLDAVTVAGTGSVEHLNNNAVTIKNGLTNNSTWNMNSAGTTTTLTFDGAQTLGGTGSLMMNTNAANRIDATASMTQAAGHTIEGTGNIRASLDNDGLVHANQGAGIDLTTNTKVNDGTMKASNNAALDVMVNVSGTGQWNADGGTIRLSSGVNVTTTGDIVVQNGGELELINASMSGDNLSLTGSGSVIDINSTVSLAGDLSFDLQDEADWLWGSGSILEMIGGVGAGPTDFASWGSLEIGGNDKGDFPLTHVGDPLGFANNFELSTLEIGAGAHVYLKDLLDNGNRNGTDGVAEALYVDTLVFADTTGVLNLNDLHLYYNNLTGLESQITNTTVPVPGAVWLMGSGLLCMIGLGRRRKGRAA